MARGVAAAWPADRGGARYRLRLRLSGVAGAVARGRRRAVVLLAVGRRSAGGRRPMPSIYPAVTRSCMPAASPATAASWAAARCGRRAAPVFRRVRRLHGPGRRPRRSRRRTPRHVGAAAAADLVRRAAAASRLSPRAAGDGSLWRSRRRLPRSRVPLRASSTKAGASPCSAAMMRSAAPRRGRPARGRVGGSFIHLIDRRPGSSAWPVVLIGYRLLNFNK